MAWFDFNVLQEQISKSVEDASKLLDEVNNYDILNMDRMALEEEEEIKRATEHDEEDEEIEEEEPADQFESMTGQDVPHRSSSNLKSLESSGMNLLRSTGRGSRVVAARQKFETGDVWEDFEGPPSSGMLMEPFQPELTFEETSLSTIQSDDIHSRTGTDVARGVVENNADRSTSNLYDSRNSVNSLKLPDGSSSEQVDQLVSRHAMSTASLHADETEIGVRAPLQLEDLDYQREIGKTDPTTNSRRTKKENRKKAKRQRAREKQLDFFGFGSGAPNYDEYDTAHSTVFLPESEASIGLHAEIFDGITIANYDNASTVEMTQQQLEQTPEKNSDAKEDESFIDAAFRLPQRLSAGLYSTGALANNSDPADKSREADYSSFGKVFSFFDDLSDVDADGEDPILKQVQFNRENPGRRSLSSENGSILSRALAFVNNPTMMSTNGAETSLSENFRRTNSSSARGSTRIGSGNNNNNSGGGGSQVSRFFRFVSRQLLAWMCGCLEKVAGLVWFGNIRGISNNGTGIDMVNEQRGMEEGRGLELAGIMAQDGPRQRLSICSREFWSPGQEETRRQCLKRLLITVWDWIISPVGIGSVTSVCLVFFYFKYQRFGVDIVR